MTSTRMYTVLCVARHVDYRLVLFCATHVVVYNCMSELLSCCRTFRDGRYNQINDSVTHVVVDSLTEDIVTQLRAGSLTSRYTTMGAS